MRLSSLPLLPMIFAGLFLLMTSCGGKDPVPYEQTPYKLKSPAIFRQT